MSEDQERGAEKKVSAEKWKRTGEKFENAGNAMSKFGKNYTCGCFSFIALGLIVLVIYFIFK